VSSITLGSQSPLAGIAERVGELIDLRVHGSPVVPLFLKDTPWATAARSQGGAHI